jgi:RNase P/RNase MRP subunit p29
MPTIEPKLVDIAGEVRIETDKAMKIYDGTKTCWVPKRLIEVNGDGTLTMPEWLAKEKGLI